MNSLAYPRPGHLSKTAPKAKSRLTLSKQERLRKSAQFRQIYSWGRKLTGPHLILFFKPNQLGFNRLGLTVSKKRFKRSWQRQYIRRRLREAYRVNKVKFSPGYDMVILALSLAEEKNSFAILNSELLSLAQKAGILKTDA